MWIQIIEWLSILNIAKQTQFKNAYLKRGKNIPVIKTMNL